MRLQQDDHFLLFLFFIGVLKVWMLCWMFQLRLSCLSSTRLTLYWSCIFLVCILLTTLWLWERKLGIILRPCNLILYFFVQFSNVLWLNIGYNKENMDFKLTIFKHNVHLMTKKTYPSFTSLLRLKNTWMYIGKPNCT